MKKALVYNGLELMELDMDKDTYKFLSDKVGGYIEHIYIESLGTAIDMWGNDEAKLIGLPPTMLLAYNGKPYDIVCGNVVFTSHNRSGETTGLSARQINFIKQKFIIDGLADTRFGVLQIMNY